MPVDDVFSSEYRQEPSTQAEEEAVAEPDTVVGDVEEKMAEGLRTYGTGKPRRVIIRAKLQ